MRFYFVLFLRKVARKELSIGYRVDANISLEFCVDVWHVVLVCIVEKHTYQNAVKR